MTKDKSEEKKAADWAAFNFFKAANFVYPPNALFSGPSRSKEAPIGRQTRPIWQHWAGQYWNAI